MKRFIACTCALLTLAGAVSCNGIRDAKAKAEEVKAKIRKESKAEPVTVKVIAVGVSSNVGTASYVGSAEATKTGNISAPASGTLVSLSAREGQKVSKGQVLAKIESQSVKSAYQMAKATYEQARDGMERLEKVYASGSISEVKMVEMKTNLSKAEAAMNAAKSSLEACTVKAPFSGVVESVPVHAGEEVTIAALLVRIVDVNSIEIHFPIPENEITRIKTGDRVQVSIPALDKEITARIVNKGLVASSLSHSYDCTLGNLSDSKDIMPGMVCKVSILSDEINDLVVPSNAVMTDVDGRYVWTVEDDLVNKRYIVVGGYAGKGIIVSEGLSEGNLVIIEGARKVSTGMAVKTIR
ncbi:MAG: efflux RND transporter periplasmic adaptor subunit [Bacteroidales bacterium]|nr:efflux RND transporter periplasmic adaptor subunit [Bacteroidales bacterium]